ncbi:thioesterase domain-containing protein [Yinghuangia sp. ASG 101]|uniref:thioesterase II family protein n=1 Tax=Yinghuangia sp. ASG 101 TaxID=2896848 RepID=UPI001E470873|nr:thioesterase domain-containing protein [Yinghuangia sp. ASG 101]UGQ12413.1 thioesterase domain-containing protein [Yinghuangia sp. ASG 101]
MSTAPDPTARLRPGDDTAAGYLAAPPPPPGDTRLPLLCFHHAGGGASAFARWQEHAPGAAVLPVQLPGREQRAGEPRFRDAVELAATLDRQLGAVLDRPHAIYGHSMGAVVAYDLVTRRARRGARQPEALVVGAYPGPHLPAVLTESRHLPDAEFARRLVAIGGMSELLLRYPDWMRAAVDLVRDDLEICAYDRRAATAAALTCPVHAFCGDADPLVRPEAADTWRRHTTGDFRLHVVPGGHFFPRDDEPGFVRRLARVLAAHKGGFSGRQAPR